ncbi:hypothetical protein POTOM_017518 [Populus tomentosa]|uniref:Major facilitator superfamily (MFS) profile domain-containing protein n=1 Tax=Populus tomentosa TaxID=118781 RepID=A0A8X7ZX87_POPTO|nr:hypothetical protein POTOM_017518 [Populus tomentosa]
MEGGIHTGTTDASAFRDCFSLAWKNPYALRLAFSAGIGVISGALLYITDDFKSVDKETLLQESIVSMAVAGAIIGAAIGGWANDRYGRRSAILIADFLFFTGTVIMASAPGQALLIIGRVFVGLGAGMASMTAPLYISEASPAKIRGALVSTHGFLITGGQFLSYLVSLAFTKVKLKLKLCEFAHYHASLFEVGTRNLAVDAWDCRSSSSAAVQPNAASSRVPPLAISQDFTYCREEKKKPKPSSGKYIRLMTLKQKSKESIDKEILEEGGSEKINLIKLLQTKTVRRGLIVGVGLQVFQQFVGINTFMYYSPSIVQLAGFASNQTALLLSLVTAGFNALGSIVSIYFIDRTGRKKLLIINYSSVTNAAGWDSMKCLKASHPDWGSVLQLLIRYITPTTTILILPIAWFSLTSNQLLPGSSLISNSTVKDLCHQSHTEWYTRGCPRKYGWVALIGLTLYIIFFSPGMGTVPWIVNSEIYPLRFRGVCGGIAATANWTSNLIVAQSFLSLTQAIGTSWTFQIFGVISVVALIFVLIYVPETKGLPIEEVEKMLELRTQHYKFWEKSSGPSEKSQEM